MVDPVNEIAQQWRDRAVDLAEWTFQNLVNRTDVWGRYVGRRTGDDQTQPGKRAITAPFREQRGKVSLTQSSLVKHYRARDGRSILGLHAGSSHLTSRWFAIDIDRHDDADLAISSADNFSAAKAWTERLQSQGFDPLLCDSNGAGGFHILVLLAQPMETRSVHQFVKSLVADFAQVGLDVCPELFPGNPKWDHYGGWLRLPGRHHSRRHYTRVWNDEPYADRPWLIGHDAIDRMLGTRVAATTTCESVGMRSARPTICVDFDGVIHAYTSGWLGATVIPDPPIHGCRESIERLRQQYRVVVHSARCHSEEGQAAITTWLRKHEILVDKVCRHKPPAILYIDDRAIRFKGDWNETLHEIAQFR